MTPAEANALLYKIVGQELSKLESASTSLAGINLSVEQLASLATLASVLRRLPEPEAPKEVNPFAGMKPEDLIKALKG